jgi:hypothetical protein
MSQKKRSATLSPTVYAWVEGMVSTGEYSDIDDAVTDLLMQIKRGTHSKPTQTGNIQTITTPVLASTTPVLTSTHTEPIVPEVVKPSLPDTKTEAPANAFFDMDFEA